jgi:hypothetical protein
LKSAQAALAQRDLFAQVKPDIGRHLVIARAPGVEFFTGIADQLGKAGLDVHVHVFERH